MYFISEMSINSYTHNLVFTYIKIFHVKCKRQAQINTCMHPVTEMQHTGQVALR
jgi:hypothetical protein